MRIVFILIIVLLPGVALAGGTSWTFLVESFERASDGLAVVVLKPTGEKPGFASSCAAIQLRIRFKREPFWRRTWSEHIVTQEKHNAALDALQSAFESAEPVRFGVMGTGLSPSSGVPCSFDSNGVAELEEHDGRRAVYSFHDPV